MESNYILDCAACEAALCEYLDGTLGEDTRALVESHLAICPACLEYERDAREALDFLRDAEPVEVPPILVNRILRQIPAKASRLSGLRGRLGRLFEPLLQPRLVMGAMMTVLSLAMMTRCAGVPNRTLGAADLDPLKIVSAFDDRIHRTWDRTVKAYDSMRLVYEIRSRVHDWRQQQEEQDLAAADAAAKDALRTRQLPAHPAAGGANGTAGQAGVKESGK